MSLWLCNECGAFTGGSTGAPRCASCGSLNVGWAQVTVSGQLTQTGTTPTMTPPLTDARLDKIRAGQGGLFGPHDLLAELDRLKARRCETCVAGQTFTYGHRVCDLTPAFRGVGPTTCATLGNGCNAWEPRT
jgi:hypothetical protein